jgi:hypothetical protein
MSADENRDVEAPKDAEDQDERPVVGRTGDHNEATEGLLDEDKLRRDAREVDQAIQDAKNRNP